MGLGELAAQPGAGILRLLDQVRRPDATMIFRADLAEIAECLLRAQRSEGPIPGGGEVCLHRGAEKAHTADHDFIPV